VYETIQEAVAANAVAYECEQQLAFHITDQSVTESRDFEFFVV
jgi:hypothetical protein